MVNPDNRRIQALFDLTGRVAIVTGGAGLLGYYHGAILASAGAHIVLLDLATANPQDRAKQLTEESSIEASSDRLRHHFRGFN